MLRSLDCNNATCSSLDCCIESFSDTRSLGWSIESLQRQILDCRIKERVKELYKTTNHISWPVTLFLYVRKFHIYNDWFFSKIIITFPNSKLRGFSHCRAKFYSLLWLRVFQSWNVEVRVAKHLTLLGYSPGLYFIHEI